VTDRRVHKSIGERFDVESTRHEDPIRRVRRRVCWVVAIVMLVGVVLLMWDDDNQVYQSRSVANPHRIIEDKCEKCHHVSFHLLQRTLGFDSADFQHACKECHSLKAPDHHPAAIAPGMVDDCTACHKEHQGDVDLTRVTDQHCVRCHGDLAAASTTGVSHFALSITSLADHPEIALQRENEMPESRHGVHQVAEWLDGQWRDRGRLVFNHAYHLHPEGVLVPNTHPDYDPEAQTPSMKILACASCHQADDDGAYMKPISYQQHCKQCHDLQFSSQLATVHKKSMSDMNPLPHVSPELIRGVLRDRLMDYIEKHSEELDLSEEPPIDPSKPVKLPIAKNKWDWVEQLLPDMENLLFASGAVAGQGDLKHGCQHCHKTEKQVNAGARVAWRIVPPDVPRRWFAHARFRHDRHDTMTTLEGEKKFRCTNCHDIAPGREAGASGNGTGNSKHEFIGSKRAGDILMPSIQVCRQCHGEGRETNSPAASDRCTECHRYHPAEHERSAEETVLLDYFHESIARQGPGK
jgi:predicted CXXCH cytochrome family protein